MHGAPILDEDRLSVADRFRPRTTTERWSCSHTLQQGCSDLSAASAAATFHSIMQNLHRFRHSCRGMIELGISRMFSGLWRGLLRPSPAEARRQESLRWNWFRRCACFGADCQGSSVCRWCLAPLRLLLLRCSGPPQPNVRSAGRRRSRSCCSNPRCMRWRRSCCGIAGCRCCPYMD